MFYLALEHKYINNVKVKIQRYEKLKNRGTKNIESCQKTHRTFYKSIQLNKD